MMVTVGFPSGISGKEPSCHCRRHNRHKFDPWVSCICMWILYQLNHQGRPIYNHLVLFFFKVSIFGCIL